MKYTVQRSLTGRTWQVVRADNVVVEGGFFTQTAARNACDEWNEAVELMGVTNLAELETFVAEQDETEGDDEHARELARIQFVADQSE